MFVTENRVFREGRKGGPGARGGVRVVLVAERLVHCGSSTRLEFSRRDRERKGTGARKWLRVGGLRRFGGA